MPIIPNITISDAVNLIASAEPVFEPPLSKTQFTLDSSGVAGFFGGDSSVRAMATVNLIPKRRWCGWYNAPGSYEVARQYGPLAMSDTFDGLFPGSQRDPAKILMIDGEVGSKFIPVHSPTANLARIGHFGYLLERKVRQMGIDNKFLDVPAGRRVMNAHVTLVTGLRHMSDEFTPLDLIPSSSITFALGTILISMGGCVACGLVADWFCFASIALGIIANGFACSVIGSGTLILKHNIPAQVNNPGDVLLKSDTEIVVLIGSEGAVSPFTRARFILQYGKSTLDPADEDATAGGQGLSGETSMTKCTKCRKVTGTCTGCGQAIRAARGWPKFSQQRLIRIAVLLLLAQFLAQLLLIPQGTLFGQLMFIATLVPSWLYHSYLSSLSLDCQTRNLFKKVGLDERRDIRRYQLNTWTEAVVFTCLALVTAHPMTDVEKIETFLDGLLPNKTDVWKAWKKALAKKLSIYSPKTAHPYGDSEGFHFEGQGDGIPTVVGDGTPTAVGDGTPTAVGDGTPTAPTVVGDGTPTLVGDDLEQLKTYFKDADRALKAWCKIRGNSEIRRLPYN